MSFDSRVILRKESKVPLRFSEIDAKTLYNIMNKSQEKQKQAHDQKLNRIRSSIKFRKKMAKLLTKMARRAEKGYPSLKIEPFCGFNYDLTEAMVKELRERGFDVFAGVFHPIFGHRVTCISIRWDGKRL